MSNYVLTLTISRSDVVEALMAAGVEPTDSNIEQFLSEEMDTIREEISQQICDIVADVAIGRYKEF